jgi:hypothetical protein
MQELPGNLDPPLDRAHADEALPFLDGCHVSWIGTASPPCVYGSSRPTRTVVLFGDSHATQWFPALDRAARAHRWRLVSLTKTTCPPVTISFWSPVLHHPFWECDRWRANAIRRIRAEHAAVVVMGAARHYGAEYHFQVYGARWLAGWRQTVRQVRASGAQVLVFGPTPRPSGNVPDCLSRHPDDLVACTQRRGRAVNAAGERAERDAVQQAGGTYVDVTPWVCTWVRCAVVVGNLLVYRDDNHVTTPFASWLAPVFEAELDASWPRHAPA